MPRLTTLATIAFITAAGMTAACAADAGNAEAGEDVFKKCRACHEAGSGAKNKVGPHLANLIGRKVGSVADFKYSDANLAVGATGAVWSEVELLKYLENPLVYMPKNKMAFAGLKDEQDRVDLLAYLKQLK